MTPYDHHMIPEQHHVGGLTRTFARGVEVRGHPVGRVVAPRGLLRQQRRVALAATALTAGTGSLTAAGQREASQRGGARGQLGGGFRQVRQELS